MGFISSATTVTIKGKLTPLGRQLLVTNKNTLINYFALGDSDADYTVLNGLGTGEVPDFSGDDNSTNNGGGNYVLKSTLYYTSDITQKLVETSSLAINTSYNYIGYNTVNYTANTISQNFINRLSGATDSLTNLFYSFGLPKTTEDINVYTGLTLANNGFADTGLSGISQDKVLVIGLGASEYGEVIDGKTIKLDLRTTASTYNIYCTYENKGFALTDEDKNTVDTSVYLTQFGRNVALLFSDSVKRPSGDATKSWSTGYATNKPYSNPPKKELWNISTDSNLGVTGDTPVGVAYLDKGFLVITEPTIVNNFVLTSSAATATTLTFNSVYANVSQQITCIADRSKFTFSSNPTFAAGDIPRITEIGLYDVVGNLIAVAKTSRTYYKPVDDIVVFNVVIDY
jgi:hypothetical protein